MTVEGPDSCSVAGYLQLGGDQGTAIRRCTAAHTSAFNECGGGLDRNEAIGPARSRPVSGSQWIATERTGLFAGTYVR